MNKKHTLIMVACCLIPIAAFALVSLFNIPLKTVGYFALVLFCPITHLLMMKYMMNGKDHQTGEAMDHSHHSPSPKILNNVSEQEKQSLTNRIGNQNQDI